MTDTKEKPFYQSKKFWSSVLAQLISVYAASQGFIDWQWVLAPALGFTVGQGMADLGKNKKVLRKSQQRPQRPKSVTHRPSLRPPQADRYRWFQLGIRPRPGTWTPLTSW